jgi:23S rRNA pseudouridine1911/1915/1917 synthase
VPEDIEMLAAELGLGRDESADLDSDQTDFADGYEEGGWDESQPIEYDEDDDEE